MSVDLCRPGFGCCTLEEDPTCEERIVAHERRERLVYDLIGLATVAVVATVAALVLAWA